MYAFAPVHHQCIHQIILIKRNGIATYRTDETLLKQTDLVIIDVDIRKDVLQYSAEHISCREEFFDTIGVFSFDNCFLTFGIFAEDGL